MNKLINKNFEFLNRDGLMFEKKEMVIDLINQIHINIDKRELSHALVDLRKMSELILKNFLLEQGYSIDKQWSLFQIIKHIDEQFGGSFKPEILDSCHIIRKWGNSNVHTTTEFGISEVVVGLKAIREIILFCFGGKIELEKFDDEIYYMKTFKDKNQQREIDIINEKESHYQPINEKGISIKKDQLISWLTFKEKIIVIPIYQRGYSWTETEIETLFQDILDRMEDDSIHYFGIIAGKLIQNNNLEIMEKVKVKIIDGQQRLTTSFLFICAVRDIFYETWKRNSNDEKYLLDILRPNNKENIENYFQNPGGDIDKNETFRKILTGNFKEINEKNEKNEYYKNYEKFKELMKNKILKENWGYTQLRELTHTFLTKFELGIISFNDRNISNKKEMEIFENLNSKGKTLEIEDLIKNFIFNLCSEELLQKYDDDQIPREYALHIMNELNNEKKLIWDFFKSLIQYNKGSETSENRQTQLNDLKNAINKLFNLDEKEEINDLKKFKELLFKIKKYAIIFYNISTQKGNRIIEWLGIDKIIKLCGDKKKISLFVELTYLVIDYLEKDQKDIVNNINDQNSKLLSKDKKEIKNLYLILMKAITKNSIVTGQGDSTFKRTILKAIYLVRREFLKNQNMTISEITKLFKENIKENLNTDDEFKKALVNNTKATKAIKWLLVLTEWEMSDYLNYGQPIYYDDPSIEHIMPQDDAQWKQELSKSQNYNESDYSINIEKIGNYFIIEKQKNSQASNSNFARKKETYKHNASPLYSQNKYEDINISNQETWNFETIEKRSKKLIEYICEHVIKDDN